MIHGVWHGVVRAWNGIPLREPWRVLLPLLVVHWIALLVFTARVNNNGWLFYQGGDQIWYWTTSWLLGQGSITVPTVSQGWSMLLVPFTWIGGPGFVGGLRGTLLLQVLVLAPVALWCIYELGVRIGGRLVGYLAALMWTVGPYLVVPLFVHRYHDRYVDQFLPHPLGLTAMADYVGMVCLVVSALFTVRAIQNRDQSTAVVAGLTAGFAGVIKPSNLLFLVAPLVAIAAARRWRELVAFGAAIAPALAALALWKYRGYGFVPAFTQGEARLALGIDIDTLRAPYERYIEIPWDNLEANLASLREVFWSMRVLQWLPIAGAIAVARRSVPLALFVSAWFWMFFLYKGASLTATVDSGSFFRLLMPAAPALVLMAAAIPLLVPTYGRSLVDEARRATPRPVGRKALIAACLLLGLAPVVAAAAVSPVDGPDVVLQENGIAVPIEDEMALSATVTGNAVHLRWEQPGVSGSDVFYKVFRAQAAIDHVCMSRDSGADECALASPTLATTRDTSYVDRPGSGTWTYRIGTAANWVDDRELGDVFLLSNPVTVRAP